MRKHFVRGSAAEVMKEGITAPTTKTDTGRNEAIGKGKGKGTWVNKGEYLQITEESIMLVAIEEKARGDEMPCDWGLGPGSRRP